MNRIVEIAVIALGILISFFLKDINFLALNIDFLNTGIVYPDFLFLYILFFAIHRGELSGLWIGFFAGILEDAGVISFSSVSDGFVTVLGVHSLVYSLAGFSLGKVKRFIDRNSFLPILIIVLFGTVVVRFFIWLIIGSVSEFNQSYSLIGPSIFTAIVSPVWFFILSWLYKGNIEEEK